MFDDTLSDFVAFGMSPFCSREVAVMRKALYAWRSLSEMTIFQMCSFNMIQNGWSLGVFSFRCSTHFFGVGR